MLINGLKFSCATCIKGHRASNCKHTDRPLFEIRKKGRPVSQCLLCRDLRKTKQLHIKCICNKNKKDTTSKKPSEPCDCQNQQKNEPLNPSPSSSSVKRLSPIIIPSQTKSSSSSTSSNSSSGSSPPSYCWALVRPEENQPCQIHSQQNMGYVFQKTNQERQRRLSKSLKGASSPSSTSTSSSVFMHNSIPSSLMSSHSKSRPKKQPTSLPNVTTTPATSTLLDNYLASTHATSLPLSRSLSSSSPTLDHDMMKELDDDLCSLLDNMIYQQQQQHHLLNQHQPQDDISSQLSSTPSPSLLPSSTNMTTHSLSSSSTSSIPIHSMESTSNSTSSSRSAYQADLPGIYGQCQKLAQWHPHGPPQGQVGESVIITMTPLPKWNSASQQNDLQTSPQQQQTAISTTKIVTCYCGPSCTCPGCLVHPTSSIFASQGLDPYAGYPVQHSVSSDED